MSDSSPPIEAIGAQSWNSRLAWQSSIAFRLAWRNITRDYIRLAIAIVGVGFAVLLMTVQSGLLIGFAITTSSLVDHAQADLWIVPRGAKDVDQAGALLERQKYLALGVAGVQSVDSLVVHFADWKRPDGGTESVIVVGIDPVRPVLQPWNLIQGSTEDLGIADGIIIDELYSQKLGITHVGQTAEIMNRRARVVGITSRIRTFTQSPYIFTRLENAKILTGMADRQTSYLLVRAEPGADKEKLRKALQAALPSSDVWTSRGFSWQTRLYWLVTTGSGAALLIAAALGVIVGVVIVSQTLYSATVERIHEYATIRAMGASNGYLKAIILRQSLLSGIAGYVLGAGVALWVARLAEASSAAPAMPFSLLLILALITLAMCVGASLVSIRKVLRVDAASVFK
ncbi:MAG TPA: ABC transporter permease [Micropepsaceae bacterium]|jgi:putative ABC transport system permease protein|nr:ABC transporter permease [Micropepsaceae bacterium]